MKWNFLGKGSAFYPAYGNTGAYALCGSELFLLDCGETAFERLSRSVDLDRVDRVFVLVTHLHADHVGSLGSLISYFYCLRGTTVHVIHPEATIVQLLTLEGIDRRGYCYEERMPENGAGLRAVPVEVRHVPDMRCYGYLLTDSDGCIYYSGDASELPEDILTAFLAGEIDRIYQDTATCDHPEPTHCFFGKLERWIPEEKRGQVFCMHLDGPWEQLLMEKGFQVVTVSEQVRER